MSRTLGGVLAPVVTPFDGASGDLAPDALARNIQAHLRAGLSGIVVAGSTGEAALLDEGERARLVELARPHVPSERWLIAGTGAESTRAAVRQACAAAARGADAVLVVAPHYYGSAMTAPALAAHYRAVADASPVPLLLYNIPKYVHFALDPQLVHDLSLHGNIIGIKDSSGDPGLFRAYLAAQQEHFRVLTGHGGSLQEALRLGAAGGVLAVSLLAPSLALDVCTAASHGDETGATAAQLRLGRLNQGIVASLGVPGIKAALGMLGLDGGPVRAPLRSLAAADRSQLRALLADAELVGAA